MIFRLPLSALLLPPTPPADAKDVSMDATAAALVDDIESANVVTQPANTIITLGGSRLNL